jgi:L-fuculose-phosphate aldolase
MEDLCELDLDGKQAAWGRKPSSEWRIHADLFRARPEVSGIVHAHPMFSTTLSILRRELPAVHYMIAVAGGATVRCADYATFGSPELSVHVQRALEGRKAALMANHGLIAVGATLAEAFKVAREIETVAEQYWRALQVGTPVVLDDAEMARVLEKFRTYGQQDC